jgi:heterodisulfide reductase subunit C2
LTEDITHNRADLQSDHEFAGQLDDARLSACLMCRTCTAVCPITRLNNSFNPFRFVRLALLGYIEEILESGLVWLCSNCYACQEKCPHGVRIPDLMTALKNHGLKTGHAPREVRLQMNIIKDNGRIYPIDEFDNKKRGKLSLPSLPTSCEAVSTLFNEDRESNSQLRTD